MSVSDFFSKSIVIEVSATQPETKEEVESRWLTACRISTEMYSHYIRSTREVVGSYLHWAFGLNKGGGQ